MTTPLAPVVAFLRRHGAVEVLEGATTLQELDEAGEPILNAVHMRHIGGNIDLWLGRATICPAALGWASKVLALARSAADTCILVDRVGSGDLGVYLWSIDRDEWVCSWFWDSAYSSDEVESARNIRLPGPMSPTPAERLKAVIEYEVGR